MMTQARKQEIAHKLVIQRLRRSGVHVQSDDIIEMITDYARAMRVPPAELMEYFVDATAEATSAIFNDVRDGLEKVAENPTSHVELA